MATLSTRKAIRRRVGKLCGDMDLLVATASGTTSTLIDEINGHRQDNSLVERVGVFSGGTAGNLGDVVRVTGNVRSSSTVAFTPTLSDATAVGDELELWNRRDQGVTPQEVNDLINDAIADVGEQSPLPVLSSSAAFDYDSPAISVDAAWEAVTGVDWQDDLGLWHPVPSADLRVDRIQRSVEILGRSRELAGGRNVRVRGANVPTSLSADSATTSVDFEWITHHVAVQCLGIMREKAFDTKSIDGNLLRLEQKAMAIRPKNRLYLKGRYWRMG